MEEDRIVRIARALCRSARLDPDRAVAPDRGDNHTRATAVSRPVAAWTQFRGAAEAFVANQDERIVATY